MFVEQYSCQSKPSAAAPTYVLLMSGCFYRSEHFRAYRVVQTCVYKWNHVYYISLRTGPDHRRQAQ